MNRFVIYRPAMGGQVIIHSQLSDATARTLRPSNARIWSRRIRKKKIESNKVEKIFCSLSQQEIINGQEEEVQIFDENDEKSKWLRVCDAYLDDLTPTSRALLLNDGVDEPLLFAFRVGWTVSRTRPGGQVAYQLNTWLGRGRHHWILLREIRVLEELTSLKATRKLNR